MRPETPPDAQDELIKDLSARLQDHLIEAFRLHCTLECTFNIDALRYGRPPQIHEAGFPDGVLLDALQEFIACHEQEFQQGILGAVLRRVEDLLREDILRFQKYINEACAEFSTFRQRLLRLLCLGWTYDHYFVSLADRVKTWSMLKRQSALFVQTIERYLHHPHVNFVSDE